MESNPKLSIIIPCFNCDNTLKAAVASCFEQELSLSEFEVVMVDDNSIDNTWDVMNDLSRHYQNIRIFSNETNKGGGGTRNIAVSHSSAEIIFCLDSDDILSKGTLKKMLNLLNEDKLDGVCLEEIISFKGNDTSNISRITKFPCGQAYELEDLIQREHSCGLLSVFMFTKKAFYKCGGYPESHGFDTQGFGWRFLCHGLIAKSCEGASYYHRVNFHQSYYLREYSSGKTNINMQNVILEHSYLLNEVVRKTVEEFYVLDFTKPIMPMLKKFPRVFLTDTKELVAHPPKHEHDIPLTLKSVKINSIRGLFFRIRSRWRRKMLYS